MDVKKLLMLQKAREELRRFKADHPKFPLFFKEMSRRAIKKDSIVEVRVTDPDGKSYSANIRLNEQDAEFLKKISDIYNAD